MTKDSLTLTEARRIALAAQGFDRPRPAGKPTAGDIHQLLRRLGVVQIDYVNVLVPAHYLVAFSRLGPYPLSQFDSVVYGGRRWYEQGGRREFTEQWAHEASIIPVETWPLLRHRMAVHRPRPWGFERFMKEHEDYAIWALDEVRGRGPLGAEELSEAENLPGIDRTQFGRIPGAWVGTVQRAVLEAHFGRGLLAVAGRRPNFARTFDLAERVIPSPHLTREIQPEEAERELLRLAARSLGVGTADDLADYYRMPVRTARSRLADLVSAGELREVQVEGWREAAYWHPEAELPADSDLPHERATLLSPFDPLIWYRPRVARLFNFDYRIEIFVPKTKRKWGYYVLPFLHGDQLVARVDLKADRPESCLSVLSSYIESGAAKPRPASQTELNSDPHAVATALAGELFTLARWLDLHSISVERRGNFARILAAALSK